MPKPEKFYPVRLVGTRSYAAAVVRMLAGDPVMILREIGNPHDAAALVAVDAEGETLGYIPRDNWLRRALVDEGRGCGAMVELAPIGGEEAIFLTLRICLTDDGPIGTRDYVPAG